MSLAGQYQVEDEAGMLALGASIAPHLRDGDVVALDGELGVGKTHLVKGIVAALGYESLVTSPTFTLVHEYNATSMPAFHIDFYRIDDTDEAIRAGLDFLLPPDEGVTLVEWASKFPNLVPAAALRIQIQHHPTIPSCRYVSIK